MQVDIKSLATAEDCVISGHGVTSKDAMRWCDLIRHTQRAVERVP